MDDRHIKGVSGSPSGFLASGQGDHGKGSGLKPEEKKFRLGQGDLSSQSGASSFESSRNILVSRQSERDVTLKTSEGDIVTLAGASHFEGAASSYNSFGKVENGLSYFSYESQAFSMGSEFTLSVSGDLNQDEIADIKGILEDLETIMLEMESGGMGDAASLAMGLLGGRDSVTSLDAQLSFQKTVLMQEKTGISGEGNSANLLDLIDKIRERILETAKKSGTGPSRFEAAIKRFLEEMASRKGESPERSIPGLLGKTLFS